jgi:hypothetical protein
MELHANLQRVPFSGFRYNITSRKHSFKDNAFFQHSRWGPFLHLGLVHRTFLNGRRSTFSRLFLKAFHFYIIVNFVTLCTLSFLFCSTVYRALLLCTEHPVSKFLQAFRFSHHVRKGYQKSTELLLLSNTTTILLGIWYCFYRRRTFNDPLIITLSFIFRHVFRLVCHCFYNRGDFRAKLDLKDEQRR